MPSSKARYLSILATDLNATGQVPSSNVLLPDTGVSAGTYGSASLVPVLVIDTKGRVTSATTSSITLAPFSTTNLAEGTNLYYTDTRARSSISATGSLSYNSSTGALTYTQDNTDTVSEGATNLYFTSTRARAALSATTGSAAYNNTSGVITIPSTSSHITEGSNLFYTDTRVRAALSGSTGVTYNSSTGAIAIGQAVGSSDSVTFNSVTVNGTLTSDDITSTNITASGNLTVSGDLTVSGTTTTVNSTTVSVADINIELARNATTAAQANGAGITITGPTTAATLTYTSADDRWNLNKDLTVSNVYGNLTGAVTGNASTATTLQTTRSIATTGDGTWTVNFDGSANVTSALTLATVNANVGTFTKLTVNDKGLVTAASAATTTDIGEGTNLYYTDTRARAALSFTAGSGAYSSATGVITIPTNNNQLTNGAGYITGYTEVDTLATVTARGATTSTALTLSGVLQLNNTLGISNATSPYTNTVQWGDNSGWILRFMTNVSGTPTARFSFSDQGYFTAVGTIAASNFSGTSSGTNTGDNAGVTSVAGVTPIVSSGGTTPSISHAASGATAGTYNNITVDTFGHVTAGSNVAYLTALSDTLATVTGRGASTSTAVTLSSSANHYNGHFYYDPHDVAGNHYPHFNDGSDNSGVKINWRLYAGANNTVTHTWTTSLATFATNIAATNFSGSSSGTNTGDNPGVTSVSGTAPVVSSGGTTPAISMAAATTSVAGYLTATDWTTFNNKQATGLSLLLAGGTLTGAVTSTGLDVSYTAQHDIAGNNWSGRIISKNASTDVAAFISSYGGSAGLFGHNSALSAWNAVYINNFAGTSQAAVYAGTLYVGSNLALHAANYSSYALPLSGGTLTGNLTMSGPGASTSIIFGDSTKRINVEDYWFMFKGHENEGFRWQTAGQDAVTYTTRMQLTSSALTVNGNTVLHAGNYNSYALPLSGGTMTNAAVVRFGLDDNLDRTAGATRTRFSLAPPSHTGAEWTFVTYDDNSYANMRFGYGDANTLNLRNDGYLTVAGNLILNSSNYNSYSPTLTGTGASGTWGISITGNAATASALSTSGTISSYMNDVGVLFQSYNASASNAAQFNITHSYGAVTISNARGTLTLNGNVSGSSGSTTGNAATASSVSATGATNLYSPNAASVVAADSAMPAQGNSLIHTLALGPSSNDGHIIGMTWANTTTVYGAQIWLDTDPTNQMAIRGRSSAGTWTAWAPVLTSVNYTSYSPTLTGGSASGTWGINITGSAATATDSSKLPLTGGTMTSGGIIKWYDAAGGGSFASNHYSMGRDNADGGWNHPFPDLIIGYHTGIRIGAHYNYKGTRFYNNSPTTDANNDGHGDQGETQLLTIGDGDNGIRKGPVGSAYTVPFVALQDTAPTAIQSGDMWWQSSTGKLKVYYNDGNTSQWVDAVPIPDTSTLYSKAGGAITGPIVANSSLSVAGTTTMTGKLRINGDLWGPAGDYAALVIRGTYPSMIYRSTTNNQVWLLHHDGNFNWYSASDGNVDSTAWTNRMYLTQAGVLNINGNTALHTGNYTSYSPTLTGGSASGTWGISITGNAVTTSQTTFSEVYSNGWLRNNNNNTGLYNTTNANHFYSRAGNRWGITGNAAGSNIYLDFYGTHESTIRGSIHADTSNNIGFLTPGGSWSFMVSSTGDATATLNVTAYSDERLKKDWVDLPNTFVEQLSKVKSGTYTRIDTNIRQAGSSAQDWQKLLPEVVVVTDDEDKTLSLAYGNAALVSAVELAKEVVSLNARIARLEALVLKLIEG